MNGASSDLPGIKPQQINDGRELLLTKDGSHTVVVPSLDLTYRSRHGAVQESMHVFINAGLKFKWENLSPSSSQVLEIFEVGFGTGLNALLTSSEALSTKQKVSYTTIEPYPLDPAISSNLNYNDPGGYLEKMHTADWNKWIAVHPYFDFIKVNAGLAELNPGSIPVNLGHSLHRTTNANLSGATHEDLPGLLQNSVDRIAGYDLVYFDAFGPLTQPDLWSGESFLKVASLMKSGAVLTTYCSKSVVRRTMAASGLHVTKINGPYGKREMVRAFKP